MTSNTSANVTGGAAAGQQGNRAAAPEWLTDFCGDYASTMLGLGWWFLVAALVVGAAGAAVLVYRTAVPPVTGGGGDEAGGAAGLQAFADALKGLIEAFSKAPTWLAMLGGGVLLLWMAGNAVPQQCYALERSASAPAPAPAPGVASPRGNNAPGGNPTANAGR